MWKITASLLLVAVLGACSGEDDGGGSAEERPGSADVYARIEAMTDCGELQGEFDTAMANVERQEAGSDEREIPMAYAEAAQARIEDLDCP